MNTKMSDVLVSSDLKLHYELLGLSSMGLSSTSVFSVDYHSRSIFIKFEHSRPYTILSYF